MNHKYNAHVANLLSAIQSNRVKSIKEAVETGISIKKTTDNINKWYEDLCKLVLEHPPDYPVKTVIIIESVPSQISKIKYLYSCSGNAEENVSFKIIGSYDNQ